MVSPEDEAGELLWKYIEELKHAEDAGAVNFVVRSAADPADLAALLPVADIVQEMLQDSPAPEAGQKEARASLVEAIRAERAPVRAPKPAPRRRFFWPAPPWQRQTVLAVLLLLLAAVALGYTFWTAYQRQCAAEPPPVSRHTSRIEAPLRQTALLGLMPLSPQATTTTAYPAEGMPDSPLSAGSRCH